MQIDDTLYHSRPLSSRSATSNLLTSCEPVLFTLAMSRRAEQPGFWGVAFEPSWIRTLPKGIGADVSREVRVCARSGRLHGEADKGQPTWEVCALPRRRLHEPFRLSSFCPSFRDSFFPSFLLSLLFIILFYSYSLLSPYHTIRPRLPSFTIYIETIRLRRIAINVSPGAWRSNTLLSSSDALDTHHYG